MSKESRNAIIDSMNDTSFSKGIYNSNKGAKNELKMFEDYE